LDTRNVLIISPHPDDMEIGMGGTVAKMIDRGCDIASLVATDGRRSTSVSGLGEGEIAKIRKAEVEEAARILGVKHLILLGLPDIKGTENQEGMKNRLQEIINQFRPAELFMTHPKIDKHPTHQIISRLVIETLDEARKGKSFVPQKIWCYEVWTPFERYDRIEDISDYVDKKSAAIDAHKSQIEYKNYTEGMKGLNRYRAIFNTTSGVTETKYAEVFIELSLSGKR
jgi:LmbE family N-acetylglucosaminyl deacetylase